MSSVMRSRNGHATSEASFDCLPACVPQSATDVERVAGALASLTPLIPGLRYFRFEPEDARCGMDLDEIHPDKWLQVQPANTPVKFL